jgi:hypothetical protein
MSIVSRFIRGEVSLWKSFWLFTFPYSWYFAFEGLTWLPRPFLTYSPTESYVRLFIFLLSALIGVLFTYGTLNTIKKYEGKFVWKSFAKYYCYLVLLVYALCLYQGIYSFPYLIKGQDPFFLFT